MSSSWLTMSAANLGQGIENGTIDPVALTKAYLAAIAAHPLKDKIYARVTADRALAEAQAAANRATSGKRLSPLDGVPVSWKDLFDTAGVLTEAGCGALRGRTPSADAEVLQNATSMGLVCLGKTHMSELAFSGIGYNPITATSPCVNDLDAVAGGSSSGAAASVAFGLAAAAIGSDTGGSVRIPSSWNDLVGLKTTIGRLSVKGTVPLCTSFDTVGPLCRTVEDASLMLSALDHSQPADLSGATLKGKRLMVLETIALDDVEASPRAAFDAAVDNLAAAGAVVERGVFPELNEAFSFAGALFTAEAYAQWHDEVETQPDVMFGEIVARIMIGKNVPAHEYIRGLAALERIKVNYLAATKEFDAVVMPSSPIMPPNVERLRTDSDYYKKSNLMALRNTRIANLMGLCSLTLPTGTPSAGILFNAPPNREEDLLRLAAAAESALA